MKSQHRRARQEAQGVAREKRAEPVYHRPAYEAHPAILALLRSIWGSRADLDPRTREMAWSFLERARSGPLTDRQLDAAAAIGKRLGIGFDDPRLDEEPEPEPEPARPAGGPPPHTDPRPLGGSRALRPQPWGPLPLRPPGR